MTLRLALCSALLLASCSKPPRPPVEDLTGKQDMSAFTLGEIRGTRDGEHLNVEAKFRDSASTLGVTLHFLIAPPNTSLLSGEWSRDGVPAGGSVQQRSIMFLGGQSSAPSIGGRFDLIDAGGTAHYRINIPTTVLEERLPLH